MDEFARPLRAVMFGSCRDMLHQRSTEAEMIEGRGGMLRGTMRIATQKALRWKHYAYGLAATRL